VNWLFPSIDAAATAYTEFLLRGLILSGAIYLAFRLLTPLLMNFPQGSAATTHRILVLLFVILALSPVLGSLKPFRDEIGPTSSSFTPIEVSSQSPDSLIHDRGVALPLSGSEQLSEGLKADHYSGLKWVQTMNWPILVAGIWVIAASVLLLRLMFAFYSLRRLHRESRILPFPSGIVCRRRIQLAESTHVQTPMAVGLWSPKVLVPNGLAADLSADDWLRVLRHEIAHLERYDDWANFLQRALIALNPFNPFLWLVGSELEQVREIVCDDWVLAELGHAESYAQLLARLAVGTSSASALAAGASRAGRQLYRRLSRLLDPECDHDLKPCLFTTLLAAIGLVASATAAVCLLSLVAFPHSARAEDWQLSEQASPVDQSQPGTMAIRAQPSKTQAADPEIIDLLKHSAENDTDPRVRAQAVISLSVLGSDQATNALLQLLDESKDDRTKISVLRGLGNRRISDPKVQQKLREFAVGNEAFPVRLAALDQLATIADDSATGPYISIYHSATEQPVKEHCLLGLAKISSKSSKDFLIETAKDDSDPEMRRMALRVLADPGFAGHHFIFAARGFPDDARSPGTLLREDFEGDLGAYVEDIVRQKLDMAAEQLRRHAPGGRALVERRHDFPADLPPPPDGPPATFMPVPDRSESGAPLPLPPPPGPPPVESAEPKSGATLPSPAPEAAQPGTVQEPKTSNSTQP
jgi:beta-lactamase regulating signal transducer with metallopeptidase domain/HEAT repeat protein